MRNILTFILCFFVIVTCEAQSDPHEYEIEFNIGGRPHGIASIHLLNEGLLCYNWSLKKRKEYIKFIPLKKLDKELYLKIQNYIYKNKIIEINEIEKPENAIESSGFPVYLKINYLNKNELSFLNYNYCDERIDGLIKLINEIIPQKYRKTHRFIPKCRG